MGWHMISLCVARFSPLCLRGQALLPGPNLQLKKPERAWTTTARGLMSSRKVPHRGSIYTPRSHPQMLRTSSAKVGLQPAEIDAIFPASLDLWGKEYPMTFAQISGLSKARRASWPITEPQPGSAPYSSNSKTLMLDFTHSKSARLSVQHHVSLHSSLHGYTT